MTPIYLQTALLAELVAPPTTRPFFEQVVLNNTVHNTTITGWVTLLCGVAGGIILGRAAQSIFHSAGGRLRQSQRWPLRALACRSLAGPLNLAMIGMGIAIGTGQLAPSDQLEKITHTGSALLFIFALAWLLYNLVDLVHKVLMGIALKTESRLDDQLVPLVRKTLRGFLVLIFLLFTAQNVFDLNISAWLAGLGIAGLAVSLAAQDSIKSVFGSVTVLMDQPFSQGDTITFMGDTGTVEELGFRSTRIRNLNGSRLTIPNSRIVDNAIENLTKRPATRRAIDIAIPYDTPVAKVELAVKIIKDILADPEIAPAFTPQNPPRVHFADLIPTGLVIKVQYWFTPAADYWGYMDHAQRFNLMLMKRFEAAGIGFAFPARPYVAPVVATGRLESPFSVK